MFILILLFISCGSALLIGAPRKCPHGWVLWRDKCFMFSIEEENWANAELRCRALGGYLAEITDAETNTFLKNHLKVQWYDDHLHYYYIGLTDAAKANVWEWSHSKTLPTFTEWGSKQPETNNEHCAALFGTHAFTWHDVVCDNLHSFICQTDSFNLQRI